MLAGNYMGTRDASRNTSSHDDEEEYIPDIKDVSGGLSHAVALRRLLPTRE